jgi:ribosomal protein S18 acetylase RimI-like enzyme
MKIKQAKIEDLEIVASLFDQYRQFYQLASNLDQAQAFLKDRIKKNESVIFLAMTETNEAAGFIQLYPSFSSLSMKSQWILNDLFVVPKFRRQEIGIELIKACEAFALETGSKGLTLMTAVDNTSAQGLYERLGWKRVSEYFTYNKNF